MSGQGQGQGQGQQNPEERRRGQIARLKQEITELTAQLDALLGSHPILQRHPRIRPMRDQVVARVATARRAVEESDGDA